MTTIPKTFFSRRFHIDSRWLIALAACYFTTVLNLGLWRYIANHLAITGANMFFFGISLPVLIFTALYLIFNLLVLPYIGKPLLILLLIISIAGLPLAGALLCGVIGIALVSSAFAGCAIARMVGHNQNRYAMAAVGGVIAGALTGLPLVGGFISGVAFVFMLGYVIQIIWRNAHLKPQQPANTPGLPTA